MDSNPSKPGWLLRCLPAAYREASDSKKFLERFLAVFESRFDECESIIKNMPRYFDPEAVPDEKGDSYLSWLGSWLSLEHYEYIGVEQNRKLMLQAMELYKLKGTPLGLKRMAEVLTGHDCYVKELMNNVLRTYGMDQCLELRDKDCSKFPRTVSLTVDCSNKKLLDRIKQYDDKVHYVWDSSSKIPISIYAVALYVQKDPRGEIYKQQIKRMLEPFLPAFLDLRIEFFS